MQAQVGDGKADRSSAEEGDDDGDDDAREGQGMQRRQRQRAEAYEEINIGPVAAAV